MRKKLLTWKVLLSLMLLVISAITVFFTSRQQQQYATRAWSHTDVTVDTICDNDGNISIQVKVKNGESKAFTAIATDSQSGKSIDLGTIKAGDTASGSIKTGKSSISSSSVKVKVQWVGDTGSDTITKDYNSFKCEVTQEDTHIRPTVVTNCAQDTWTITGYTPPVDMSKVDHIMVEIGGLDYNTIYPTGSWNGKNSLKFWIHVYYKDGTKVGWDADQDRECKNQPTNTPTPSQKPSNTPTKTPTKSPTPSVTKTQIPSNTPTLTPSVTKTQVPSNTPGPSSTPTHTPTRTPTNTPTDTPTPTNTPTPTSLLTNTPGPSPTFTPTNTPTATPTATSTPTNTPTPTTGPSATPTTGPSATPTEIIVVVNNTSTPVPTDVTVAPTIPSAGIPIPFVLIGAPLLLLVLALLF